MASPTITFALIAYNQARFIEEAIRGAFSQTWEPMQVLLSDDSSTDDTFERMKSLASLYVGPHRILLNRNPKNLGIAGHINRVMELTTGDFVAIASGDDVSLPRRVEHLIERWRSSGETAMSIYSPVIEIDERGDRLGVWRNPHLAHVNDLDYWAHNNCAVTGSSHMWHRKVFDVFGPLKLDVEAEDMTIPFRSRLLGTIEHCDEPLVLRRRHGGGMTWRPAVTKSVEAMRYRDRVNSRWSETAARQQLCDLRTAGRNLPSIERGLRRKYSEARFRRVVVDRPLLGGLRYGLEAIAHGSHWITIVKPIIQYSMPRLFLRYLRIRLRGQPAKV